MFDRMCGMHRARFWSQQGYPNLVRARAARAEKVRQRKLEEWKRAELKRTPYALLDDPSRELRPRRPKSKLVKPPAPLPSRKSRPGDF